MNWLNSKTSEKKNTHHIRGIYRIHLKSTRKAESPQHVQLIVSNCAKKEKKKERKDEVIGGTWEH